MTNVISEECAVVSFYGIEPTKESVAGFYQDVLDWFQELGYPADKLGVIGRGHSGKPVSFKRGDAKLQKTGFDEVKAMDISSLIPDARIPVNDYLLTASWSANHSYACVVSRSSIVALSHSGMLPFAQKVIRDVKPAYGIGYNRNHSLGPAMYAVGICQGLGPGGYGVGLSEKEQKEADSISRWGDGMAAKIWEKGILRDVYPWNLLTQRLLTKPVGGVPLERWIQQSAERGKLEPLCEGVSLWEIEGEYQPAVRQTLQKAGIIFDWQKHL